MRCKYLLFGYRLSAFCAGRPRDPSSQTIADVGRRALRNAGHRGESDRLRGDRRARNHSADHGSRFDNEEGNRVHKPRELQNLHVPCAILLGNLSLLFDPSGISPRGKITYLRYTSHE